MAKLSLFERRRRRVRTALRKRSGSKPRLSVHRTGQHIYAQVIDDGEGRTIASANTLGGKSSGANVDAAAQVGKDIAAAATKAGVTTVEISGIDKQAVGQFAAEIRRWRKPEPYKGKGIKYRGEYIFRKEGKKK